MNNPVRCAAGRCQKATLLDWPLCVKHYALWLSGRDIRCRLSIKWPMAKFMQTAAAK